MNKEYKKCLVKEQSVLERSKPRKVIRPVSEKEAEQLFLNNNTDRPISDLILANLIVLTAIALSAFIPVISFALPILLFIYLDVGLWGFVLCKERGQHAKYETLFVSVKKYIKSFCMMVVKMFLIVFWSIFLIVPGVICALNYSFTSLILFESEDLDVKGALMLSKELVRGFRWKIFFWGMISAAAICVSMTLIFVLLLIFDIFLIVPNYIYIIFVLAAGILSLIVMAMPMMELVVTDCYILSKNSRMQKAI